MTQDSLHHARGLIESCESDLQRKLSDGERRDLLKDNTDWTSDFVAAVVKQLRSL